MSEWSQSAARRSRQRLEAKFQLERKAVQDKETLDSKGRALWTSVKGVLARKCEEFNAEPGNKGVLGLIGTQTELTVRCSGQPQNITGSFNFDSISFSGKNGINFETAVYIRLTKDGMDVWLADGGDNPVDFDNAANEIIEAVLEGSGR